MVLLTWTATQCQAGEGTSTAKKLVANLIKFRCFADRASQYNLSN